MGKSYLQRLVGNFDEGVHEECCGIESIIHPNFIKTPSDYNNWSFVDNKFFLEKEYTCSYFINGLDGQIRLDPASLAIYNVPATEWVDPGCP